VLPLQSGVMSNAVPFTVNLPQIESISPTSGTGGTLVTFTGSGFGSSPGTVWLGSTAGQYQQWTDTLVTAVVAPTALSGIAKIQPSGGAWSNAVGFTVPTSGGASMTLAPAMLNMVVGDTRTLQALSSTGQSMTGLAWTSSDKTVVSLSTDDPPVLTAVSAGHATITAGTGSADVTVSAVALAVGTVIWSNSGNGSGVDSIVPAVPSATGVADVFAFQDDGTVQAITSDGTTAWTADVSNVDYSRAGSIFPDFQGGLVVVGDRSIWKLDGTTGQPYPAYTSGNSGIELGHVAVHTDGTIFAVLYNPGVGSQTDWSSIVGIDPTTGTQKFNVSLGESQQMHRHIGPLIVAGDGYAYVASSTQEYGPPDSGYTNHINLLRVNSSGAHDDFGDICDWWSGNDDIGYASLHLITNADKGVLLTWGSDAFGMAITTGATASLVTVPQIPGERSTGHMLQCVPLRSTCLEMSTWTRRVIRTPKRAIRRQSV
jgi:hypothetical protein